MSIAKPQVDVVDGDRRVDIVDGDRQVNVVDGDSQVNLSVDAKMDMTNDGHMITEKEDSTATNQNIASSQTTQTSGTSKPTQLSITSRPFQPSVSNQRVQPTMSYVVSAAQPAQSTGARTKTIQNTNQSATGLWIDQIKEIITDHNQGNRILILMRGVPGSGKSYLARQLVDMMIGAASNNYKTHILSTDDYFMVRGQYQFDKNKFSDAHLWNRNRARNAFTMGLSPVIIDNTNIELWEMEPYLREGVKNGYIIQVVEAKTSWAKKINQLTRKNVHNVPSDIIERMLEKYRDGVTGTILRQIYGLAYPADKIPPIKRTVPPIVQEESVPKSDTIVKEHTAAHTTSETVASSQLFRSSTSTVNVQKQQVLTVPNSEQQNDHRNTSKNQGRE